MSVIENQLLKINDLEEREYQNKVSDVCLKQSTLAVLPTGLGKTIIALRVILERIQIGKILFLAPTKPLAQQHANFFEKYLNLDIELFTGNVAPKEREKLWKTADFIISTPQVVEKDVERTYTDLKDFSLVVFDEAHRAVGNYAYVKIGEVYRENAKHFLTLGMTASPGSTKEHIVNICNNLGIKKIEKRSDTDEDVIPYIQKLETTWIKVEMTEVEKTVRRELKNALGIIGGEMYKQGFLSNPRHITTSSLLRIGKEIQVKLMQTKGSAKYPFYNAMTTQAIGMKIAHAIQTIESQGLEQFLHYAERIEQEAKKKSGSRANKQLVKKEYWKTAINIAKNDKTEHPKLPKLLNLINMHLNEGARRIIVFTEIRHTATLIVEKLERVPLSKSVRFVGQSSREGDRGLTQNEQKEILDKFRSGEYNVLVATSVGEEGLDIPSTDVVIFYEPVPSAIRLIQRRGRTGRDSSGIVYMFMTEDTRDEAAHWSSRSKEREMYRMLENIDLEIDNDEILRRKTTDTKQTKLQ